MNKYKQVTDLKHRIQQSVFEDGLMELMIGVYLFLLGWIIQINTYLVVFSVFLIFLMNPLFERAKKRYIYPRAGFVKLRAQKETVPKGIVAPALIIITVIVLVIFIFPFASERDFSWWFGLIFPISTGVMMAMGPIWFARTYRLLRGYVYAVLILAGAFVIPLSGFAQGAKAVGWVWLMSGFLAMVWGGWMFYRFIRIFRPEESAHVGE